MIFKKHIFLCENKKEKDGKVTGCGRFNTSQMTKSLKELVNSQGLKGVVRVSSSGCLGQCDHGPVLACYPDGQFLTKWDSLPPEEVLEICLERKPVPEEQNLNLRLSKPKPI